MYSKDMWLSDLYEERDETVEEFCKRQEESLENGCGPINAIKR